MVFQELEMKFLKIMLNHLYMFFFCIFSFFPVLKKVYRLPIFYPQLHQFL